MNPTTKGAQPWWQRVAPLTFSVLLAFSLSGCDLIGSDDDDPVADPEDTPDDMPVGTAFVRIVHAVADAPDVNGLADGTVVVEGLAFKQATDFLSVDATATEISVDALTAGGEVTVIMPTSIDFQADTQYTVAAIGSVATIAPLVIENAVTDIGAGNVRVQVAHTAPSAPTVDVYVTAPDDMLADAGDPLVSFSFGENTGQVEVPAGDYRIRVTPEGDVDTVVYDSGTLSLIEGLDLAIFAVDNSNNGDSPISLLVADGADLADPFEVIDADTPTSLRVVHASPDAPPVDVIANDDFANPVFADLAYGAITDFAVVPVAEGETSITLNVKVT
ncbi:MAG: DUF4397 domain-containing protein, partial [Pseudomonadota bacterium]